MPIRPSERERQDTLLAVVDGLVCLRVLLLRDPSEMAKAIVAAPSQADVIGSGGDHITAPGNFLGRDAATREGRQIRRDVLNAMAACLALGAYQEGGITWWGRHWCTAAHDQCPNGRETETEVPDAYQT